MDLLLSTAVRNHPLADKSAWVQIVAMIRCNATGESRVEDVECGLVRYAVNLVNPLDGQVFYREYD